ncbi:MAG: MopE-related protein [Deltaproteobacteria bacterium]
MNRIGCGTHGSPCNALVRDSLVRAALTLLLVACESAPLPPEPVGRDRYGDACARAREVCNGLDDNCNGIVDDVLQVEVCNGEDDDCNGIVDDDVGSTEVCNGEDDDCNGIVDDVSSSELCDGIDQDCDGSFDEGAACDEFEAPGPEGWQLGPTSRGVLVTEDGALVLEPARMDIVQPALWVANTGEGTVSRLDARTGRETARYPSATESSGLLALDEANAPSRTALDQRLDAYVANRAFGGQASVSKIAGDLERCVDRDLDGVIQTSADLDGDGVISTDPTSGEFFADDECVLWTVPVGARDAIARALAIGLAGPDGEPGTVWVGLFNEQRSVALSPSDGHELASVPLGLSPYGAVAAADGRLWFTPGPAGPAGTGDELVAVDPGTFAVERASIPGDGTRTYGIAVDGLGRIVLAANDFEWSGALAYDPRGARWTRSSDLPAGFMRGVAASNDAVWVAGPAEATGEGALFELSLADLSLVSQHDLPGANDLVGVGIAFDRRVWGIAQGADRAFRLDRATGEISSFPTGRQPYTYSDFTGFGLNGILGAVGTHQVTIEGCEAAVWTAISLDADIPPETSVVVRARSAATSAGLSGASWFGAFETAPTASLQARPGPVPAGRLLEISLRLSSSTPGVVPRVRSLAVSARCDGLE